MKNLKDNLITAVGIILLVAGLILIKILNNPQGILHSIPYILVGLGSVIFGHGMGNLVTRRITRNHPAVQKQMEIDRKDERNIMIRNAAKSKAYDVMTFVFGALLIAIGLMSPGLAPFLLLVFAYLFVLGTGIYFRIKFEKEM